MSIIDFKEIPEAHKPTGDQDVFELFARDFLEALGFSIIEGPGRGIDRGRDLLVTETVGGTISTQEKIWVVSAKHKAHSGKSVTDIDEPDPMGRVRKFKAQGFMGFYSTVPSSGLDDTFSRVKPEIDVYVFDKGRIEKELLSQSRLQTAFQQYFPLSYQGWESRKTSALGLSDLSREASALLTKVHSRSVPLSQCVAEALTLAQKANNSSLEEFCRNELSGWKEDLGEEVNHRAVEAFLTVGIEINVDYWGWDRNPNKIRKYMLEHPQNFIPWRLVLAYPISEIESQSDGEVSNALITSSLQAKDVIHNPEARGLDPDLPVKIYAQGNAFQIVLESTRRELTARLLSMLPRIREESVRSQ